MDDRTLLELAAKAADVSLYAVWSDFGNFEGYRAGSLDGDTWNPLTDDGDALRLAVKLRIDLSLWINLGSVTAKTHIGAGRSISLVADNPRPVNDHTEPRGTDETAATRRAIVRAAAEIGRSME